MVAIKGEQAGHAFGQGSAAGTHEHQGRTVAGRVGNGELGDVFAHALLLDAVVHPLRQRNGHQASTGLLDQGAIDRQRRHGGALRQQIRDEAVQICTLLRAHGARQVDVPVSREIRLQTINIKMRGVVQHQVSLERFVLQVGLIDAGADLVFHAQRQSWEQGVDQHALIGLACCRVQLATLIEPPAQGPRHIAIGLGQGQLACGLERRHQDHDVSRGPVGCGLQQGFDFLLALLDRLDVAQVVEVTHAP